MKNIQEINWNSIEDKIQKASFDLIPEDKVGLVILANSDYNEDFRQEILHPIVELMLTMFERNEG